VRRRAVGRARPSGCARPGPSTPDAAPRRAARGGGSCDCVVPSCYCFLGCFIANAATGSGVGSGLLLVRLMREGARAAPAPAWCGATCRGAVTAPAPCWA